MRIGRNLTKDLQIDSKQHELLGFDMGEGVDRRTLVLGVIFAFAWVSLLLLVFGPPMPQTFIVYFMPPILLTVFGVQASTRQPRRRNLTQWILKLRQVTVAHRPIIRTGRRKATRQDHVPLGERFSWETVQEVIAPGTSQPRWLKEESSFDYQGRPVGPAIELHRRPARLIGQDHADKLAAKYAPKKKGS
ncbi:hypothetical protein MG599_24020 (plasmid) [Paenarthrobacter sp. SD-1]|uniref:Uncharacterized protein n=1 Tax=Paenarthrobacter ureafaciens TaxID=37931 RepID=A0AAX3EQU2_PAEUR|nr:MULTISPECIES: hypothetical protein [Paenarthrobacter]MDO5878338.1 hypothetical protein [Paenarthrobacter sp. SD-1]UYW00217.1 hypothetical protein NL394_23965 [Paenarthrobacter ureafaciens]